MVRGGGGGGDKSRVSYGGGWIRAGFHTVRG